MAAIPANARGQRIKTKLSRDCGKRLRRLRAVDERRADELSELPRIRERLVQRIQAAANRINLPFVAGKAKQSGRVASC